MMGYSYSEDDTPLMCFNGPKSWQLNWYNDSHVELDPTSSYFSGDLVGVADYSSGTGQNIILKLINSNKGNKDNDYYVTFNRATGINASPEEGGDQVLVTRRVSGTGYEPSYLLALLSANSEYTLKQYDGTN